MNPEVVASVAGRVENVIGRIGLEDVLMVLTGGVIVRGGGAEDDCTLKVNAGGRMLDCGSEAGVRDPAGNFGTSAKVCLAFGVQDHGEGGRKAEGVCLILR